MKLSIPKRIFLALFVGGLLPFYGLLYFMYLSSYDQLRQTMDIQQYKRLEAVSIMVQQDIDVLEREAAFLAALPLMDDLISDDIDHRIDNLLALKQKVYKLDTELRVDDLKRTVAQTEGFEASKAEGLLFRDAIYASFDPAWQIGSVEILLPFAALNHYFTTRGDTWCVKRHGKAVAGTCKQSGPAYVSFSGKLLRDDLQIALAIDRTAFEAPLEVLKRQLLTIALFSLAALSILFVFLSRLVSRPIAQNIRFQQQQLGLLEAARQSAEAKSRFTSQMSHEFRTPLNSIIGFSQFLESENLVDPEYRKIPKMIEQSGKDLLALINQILDFAKAEQTVPDMKPERINLKRLVEEAVENLRPQAEAKGLELSSACDAIVVMADARMTKSIAVNLLANAIKYTHSGYVHVYVRGDAKITLGVRDSGIGIAPEEVKRLFQPFTRFKGSEKIQGSGLGLALSYAYAERMGAGLSYRAQEAGSEFVLAFETALHGDDDDKEVRPMIRTDVKRSDGENSGC